MHKKHKKHKDTTKQKHKTQISKEATFFSLDVFYALLFLFACKRFLLLNFLNKEV